MEEEKGKKQEGRGGRRRGEGMKRRREMSIKVVGREERKAIRVGKEWMRGERGAGEKVQSEGVEGYCQERG